MKQQTKKIMGALVSLLMVLALIPVGAGAAPNTPLPATGSLTITKYVTNDKSGFTTTDAYPENGTQLSGTPAGATALGGITFKLYKVTISPDANGAYPQSPIVTWDSYLNPTKITDTEGVIFDVTPAGSVTTATDGTGSINTGQIAQGVYYVVEQPDPRVTAPSDPFVVAVPMVDPADQSSWLDPVFVYPKNETLTVTKTVNKPSASVGDTVTFSITAGIPSDLASTTGYKIIDTLPAGLTYKSVDSVLAATTVAGLASGANLAGLYAVTTAANATDPTATDITITPSGPVATAGTGLAKLVADSDRFIQITITATVNKDILDAAQNNTVTNSAVINFTNKFNDPYTSTEATAAVHTGTIDIKKVDQNGDPLAGAEFHIALTEADAKAGNFLKLDSNGNVIDPSEAAAYATATDWKATSTVNSDGDAVATFAGLADYTGTTPGYNTYWVVETKAPATYNLLPAPVKITFDNTAVESNNYTLTTTVANNKGFILPLTGEMGILIFTIAGVALLGVAILLVVNGKKHKGAHSATIK
ncbi:MAG: SpaH/EbpB family LPXTG-anchored major pilin [Actinomycetia bacterium]|nr:SpaH/EbpB family LPXTG-anchored major pilin [Actinomycetes bacterium]